MTGVRINELGPITELARVGVQIDTHASSSGYMPYKQTTVFPHTLSTTGSGFLAVPGMQTVSGAFPVTIQLPTASLNPGAMFTFVNTSGKAHALTGSNEAPFVGGLPGSYVGSKLTLSASVNGTVALLCDGTNYLVMVGSGTISGT